MIKVTIWNEGRHEKNNDKAKAMYPKGIHGTIADYLSKSERFEVRTATLDDPQQGLPDSLLNDTDVLLWWGHGAHKEVNDELVDRIQARVLKGMGLIVLHSSHHSKIFKRLMGTTCDLMWRDDDRERIWTALPGHPIAQGVPAQFELEEEEMYGEFFDIPQPDELIFLGWFKGGEVFRSGCTFHRGYGKIFYFQPGHETNSAYHNPHVLTIIKNAVKWAKCRNLRDYEGCPHPEPLEK